MGGDRFAGKALPAAGHGGLYPQELLSLVGGLHHEGAAHHLPGHGHMLVSGQQDVEIQLLTDAVGDVFAGRGEHATRGEVALEAAVVNADRQVDLITQPFQRVDARGKAHPRLVPADVFAHAARFQHVEVAVKVWHPVVEVMVAQRHIVIAAAVHHLGKARGAADGIVAERPQRRALQDVAAVDDEGVAVLAEAAGALEQPQLLFPLSAVIGRINVAVQVGGKIDRQLFFVHRLPPCQLHADLR